MTRTGSVLSVSCTYHNEIRGKLFAYLTMSSDTTPPPWSGNPDVVLYGGFSSGATNNYAVYHSTNPIPFNFDYYKDNPVNNTGIRLDRDLYGYVTDGIVEINRGVTIVTVFRNGVNKFVLQYNNVGRGPGSGLIYPQNLDTPVSTDSVTFIENAADYYTIQDDSHLVVGETYRIMDLTQQSTTHYIFYYTEFTIPPLNP